ncbi:MAG TPA: NDP-sugar synthase [Solirubrobacteraceae bacterium]|nr:NDP-sugar synthase [Solirubrobacteraceae bacterium]
MQAVILAGGEGTRLRPLTTRVAKPIVTLVDRPFIVYMLEWLRRHGVDEVILCCGFGADGVRDVLGDGSDYGLRLRYVEESEPLGTAGPLVLAREHLEPRFFVCNGDILTDIDLGAQLAAHERTHARATLALIAVADPSAYGLVRTGADGAVTEFLEKPSEPIGAGEAWINAGAYVLEREVLDLIESGRAVSIEREIWPALIGHGLYGHRASGYWLDIGTPARYLQGSFDIITGAVEVERSARHDAAAIGERCEIAADARLGELVVLGERVRIGARASIERSVVLAGAQIGAGCVLRESIVGERAKIGAYAELEEDVVVGEDARIAAHSRVAAGTRVAPGACL